MLNRYTSKQICLLNKLRQLWEQHVYWTRFFIISTAADLPDLIPVTNRLFQNPKDFADFLTPIYRMKKAKKFQELLAEHLQIAGDLVTAAKNHDTSKVNDERIKWYKNADEIAIFLSSINRYWNKEKWNCMLCSHLKMTEEEAALRLQGKYIENGALEMADYMFCGIIKYCF